MRVTIANGEEETVNTAPWRRRSLLRRPRWARGAALMAKRGLRMLLTLRRHKEQRPFSRARRRGASVVAVRLAACVVVAAALWSAAPAVADDVPPVPGVTTTTDAPPPDPYSPPARTTKPKPAARSVTPAVRSAPTTHYVPPAASCSGPRGRRAAAQDQAPGQGGSDKANASGEEPKRLAAVQGESRAASDGRCCAGAASRAR